MAQTSTQYERYLSDFEAFETGLSRNGASWIDSVRHKAISHFAETGMPTARRGNERWKYTNIAPIARVAFEYPLGGAPVPVTQADLHRIAPWDDEWTTLVFVDGRYSAALSRQAPRADGTQVVNLSNALDGRRGIVEEHLARYARVEDDDGFASLNTAFLHDGAFVRIPPDDSSESTVHLLFVTTKNGKPTVSYPRTLVLAGRSSRTTIIESYVTLSDEQYFTNAVAEIALEDGAAVDHYRVMIESENAFHIGTTRVHLGRDSTFTSLSFAHGARIGRNDLHVVLDAPGSECTLNGLYMTSGRSHLDNHISVTHTKPHGTSHQYYKGILTDKSRAVFSGVVLVERDAQKTYAVQRDMNLLLSDGAEVDTKPSLLIYADDVKCFHGAATGEMDEHALFYMLSRGLDREAAERMLIRAFAGDIVEKIKPESLRRYIENVTTRLLPAFRFKRKA